MASALDAHILFGNKAALWLVNSLKSGLVKSLSKTFDDLWLGASSALSLKIAAIKKFAAWKYLLKLSFLVKKVFHVHPELGVILWVMCLGLLPLLLVISLARYRYPSQYRRAWRYSRNSLLALIAICFVYYIGVDSTIKSNSLLRLAREYQASVRVSYFNCGDDYGYYSPIEDRLVICNSATKTKGGADVFTSKESTIRHEIWHRVQACAYAQKSGRWGGRALVDSSLLTRQTLPKRFQRYVSSYPPEERPFEDESVRAEIFSSDYQIAEEFKSFCSLSMSPIYSMTD